MILSFLGIKNKLHNVTATGLLLGWMVANLSLVAGLMANNVYKATPENNHCLSIACIISKLNKVILLQGKQMNGSEIARLQAFFANRFKLDNISVRPRPNKTDSAEVYMGDEFIGVLFRDDEDGEVSYDFNMAILEIDLPE